MILLFIHNSDAGIGMQYVLPFSVFGLTFQKEKKITRNLDSGLKPDFLDVDKKHKERLREYPARNSKTNQIWFG